MNDLLKTQLFSLLSESSQEVPNEKMKRAYEDFVKQVNTINESENNLSEIFRMLNITRIELIGIESIFRYEQGKKCA